VIIISYITFQLSGTGIMPGPPADRQGEIGESVYGQNNNAGPKFGEQATCELCEIHRRCFDEHGLLACRPCHRELLPGTGVI